jgi:hypothetical protein
MRDGPGLVADGNGNGFDSPEIFEAFSTERIFETLEDLPLGVSCQTDAVRSEEVCLPVRRKINGNVSLAVWKFERGVHSQNPFCPPFSKGRCEVIGRWQTGQGVSPKSYLPIRSLYFEGGFHTLEG